MVFSSFPSPPLPSGPCPFKNHDSGASMCQRPWARQKEALRKWCGEGNTDLCHSSGRGQILGVEVVTERMERHETWGECQSQRSICYDPAWELDTLQTKSFFSPRGWKQKSPLPRVSRLLSLDGITWLQLTWMSLAFLSSSAAGSL